MREYRRSHTGTEGPATGYDDRLFGPGRYEYEIWQQEKRLLDALVDTLPRRDRLLDFACGTGRILAHLEDRFQESVGLDISPDMLANAGTKLRRSTLVCGDATRDPDIVDGSFDFITAFRFFLNAEPTLRDEAMAWLAGKLRDEHSILLFNVHGNYLSTRQIAVRIKQLQGKRAAWMKQAEVKRLVTRHGLEILNRTGISHVDKAVYKHLPRKVWGMLEKLARFWLPRWMAINVYFVCRRRRR